MYKAKFLELGWWVLKWVVAGTIVAAIVVVSVQIHNRLDRHNLLVDALLNDIRQVQVLRQKADARAEAQAKRTQEVLQELPK